jgi:hypothetical protein
LDALTRENCAACVLAGYGATEDGPNYVSWARVYTQAGKIVPSRWADAYQRELDAQTPYGEALRRDVATFGDPREPRS